MTESVAKPKINLIPWLHDVFHTTHDDLMEFIKGLSSDSVIALECTPKDLVALEVYLDVALGNNPEKRFPETDPIQKEITRFKSNLVETFFNLAPSDFAILDLLLECRKRKIKVKPIDIEYDAPERITDENYELMIDRRNDAFCDNVTRIAKRTNGEVYVITGVGHTLALSTKFSIRNIQNRVRYDVYRNPQVMEELTKVDALDAKMRGVIRFRNNGVNYAVPNLDRFNRQNYLKRIRLIHLLMDEHPDMPNMRVHGILEKVLRFKLELSRKPHLSQRNQNPRPPIKQKKQLQINLSRSHVK